MPRRPRVYLPNVPAHIVQRGHNRQATFYAEEDYQYYLTCAQASAEKYQCDIHAYVLMTNHVHWLITPKDKISLSRFMQSLGRSYVRYINHVYKRSGSLWEGRYKSSLVNSEHYLLTCYRYIELKPVRAGMVEHPTDYKFSSARFHCFGEDNALIKDHDLYIKLGANFEERQHAYRELFKHKIDNQLLHVFRSVVSQERVLTQSVFNELVTQMKYKRLEPVTDL